MFEPAAFARMERRGALEVGGWTVEKTSRLVAPRNTSRVSGHLPILAVDFCGLMFQFFNRSCTRPPGSKPTCARFTPRAWPHSTDTDTLIILMAFAPPATRRRLSPRCSHLRTLHSLLLSSPIATHANVLLHDGTKNPTRLFTAVTPPSTRVLTTRSVPLLRAMRSLHPTNTPQRRKKENTLTPNTQEVPRQAHPHTRGTLVIIIILALPPRAPRYPHIPPIPRLISSQSLSRHKHKTHNTQNTRPHTHRTAPPHKSRHNTPHEAYR